MLVKQLIDLLQTQPQDAEVMFQYNYGDYWRTQVAEEVRKVEEMPVEYSEYHQMHKLIGPLDRQKYDDEPSNKKEKYAVVIG